MEKNITAVVDITEKSIIKRTAKATGLLKISKAARIAINNNEVKKGNVIEASTIAAIQAVKETPRIIPHCHPVPLEGCDVNWRLDNDGLRCDVSVVAHYKTGIEMEAITGVCAGLL
ncbi:MAG: cyclic pyranopterin monophosphate synthase MoaC, partial [Candidatus Poseidoniaceae archaeon]|nr:cyclic pyranopterin monophosphate synthase MoaC [Candidatus Poseidoniaceae archaeon]